MQTFLLVIMVVFALAIGFFLGLFLLSMDTPLTKKIINKESSDKPEETTLTAEVETSPEIPTPKEEVKKPTPGSRLLLKVWKEEGNPPVYELDGTYLDKENLPRELLNVITVHEGSPSAPETKPRPAEDKIPPIVQPEEDPEPELKILSVIDEVNDILQKKLADSPLAGKGIHLMENHNKEIRFWVGLNSYDDVDQIPDPEVRHIIDAAVKEWEKNRE
jgi:hypothetical protein